MSPESILLSNYAEFIKPKKAFWLLYCGFAFIVIGLIVNFIDFDKNDPTQKVVNSNYNANASNNNVAKNTPTETKSNNRGEQKKEQTNSVKIENIKTNKDYLIVDNSNSIEGLQNEIEDILKRKGNSSIIENDIKKAQQNHTFKKMIVISLSVSTKKTSVDETALSTKCNYNISIYDMSENKKLISTKIDNITVVGFSENENQQKIKKQIINKINSDL